MAYLELPVVEDHERFRSELASVESDGRRKWIYARKPHGKFYRARSIVSYILLAFLGAAPFVQVNGHQFLLFNILKREFVFFGMVFWPSDFYLVALLFLTGIISLVVFTATLGRIWCGWLCPQTIFLEMVFRKIEWMIEGTPKKQAMRNAGPWNLDRIWRFSAKQTIFLTISFAIANVFLAYFVSGTTLRSYIADGPSNHIELFLSLLFFTTIFYLVFARFREQACIIVCPYGRYMSALMDENTVTVSYDTTRGESRSKWKKNDTRREEPTGHCIDCYQCVTVCPTGIDIRNGTQLECVACTACMDACDEVMTKVGLPTGLIRYASAKGIERRDSTWLTPRIKAYLTVWSVMVLVVVGIFLFRSTLEITVLRAPGTTWTKTTHGIANFYDLEITNKRAEQIPVNVRILQPSNAAFTSLGLPSVVKPGEMIKGRFLITLPNVGSSSSAGTEASRTIELELVSGDETLQHITTKFLAPDAENQ